MSQWKVCKGCGMPDTECVCPPTEPPARDPPDVMEAAEEICKHIFSTKYDNPITMSEIIAQGLTKFVARQAASSHAELRGLPARWRECAHLCQTTGLKDERAMHRAIVYDECAAALETALGEGK